MAVNQNGMQAGKHSIACSSRVNNRTAMDTAQSLRMASVSHNRKSRTVFLRIICFVCKLSFFALAHSQECAGYDIADGRVTVSVAHRNWETSKTVQLGFAGQVTASKCEGAMLTTSAVAAKDCPPPARSCVKVWLNEATEENLQLGLDLPYRERSLPQRRQFACDVDAKGAIVVNSIACEDIQPPSPPPPPRPPSPFPPPPPRSPPPPRPSPPPFPPLLPRPPETPWPSPPPSPPPPPPPPSPSPPPLPPPSPPPSASPLPPILSALPLAEVPSPPAPPGIIPRSLFISSITSLGSVLGVMVTVAGAIKLRRYLNERKRRLPRGGRASAVGDQALGTAVRPRAKKGGKYGMVPSADDEQDDDDDEDEEQDLDQVGAVSAVLFKAKTTTYPPIVSAGFCDALKDDATTVVGLSSSRPAPPPTIHSSNSRPARPNSPTVVDVPQGFQGSAQGEDKSETQPIPTLDSLEAAIIAEVKSAHTHVAENRPKKSSKMDQGQNDMD